MTPSRGSRRKNKMDELIENVEEVKDIFVKVSNCKSLALREQPLVYAPIIGVLMAGDILKTTGFFEDWVSVITSSGASGFVMQSFVEEV
jgi:hypothetical protein